MNTPGYLSHYDRLPPCLCWLVARHNRRPIPLTDISQASGMSRRQLNRLFKRRTWANITIAKADAIRAACGITPSNQWQHLAYLRRTLNPRRVKHPLVHFDHRPNQTITTITQSLRPPSTTQAERIQAAQAMAMNGATDPYGEC